MSKVFLQPEGVDWAEYNKTAINIQNLKSRLSEDAAAALANEVLSQVNARFLTQTSNIKFEPSSEQIDDLARALMNESADAGELFISNLYKSGINIEDIYLVYLANAARRLGEWWDNDTVSFIDVRIGASRIYAILHTLDKLVTPKYLSEERTAFFASIPDELHTLGVNMAADIFKQNGWKIDLFVGLSHDELIAEVDKTKQSIICLSAGGSHSIDVMAKLVLAIRIQRPELQIVICGNIVEEMDDLISVIEPDGVASDIETGLSVMENLLSKD